MSEYRIKESVILDNGRAEVRYLAQRKGLFFWRAFGNNGWRISYARAKADIERDKENRSLIARKTIYYNE